MSSLIIRPQKGAQEQFLSTNADVCCYGGSAGGGKTYALLLEALRHVDNPEFNGVIFRKNANQITAGGGLWDTAMTIYPLAGGVPRKTPKYMFCFPSGAKITFAHLERYTDALGYQGAQIPLIAFDEATHFDEAAFWYMFSRNRSMCGVKPYIRMTTNPDPDSFVAKLLSWWIHPDTGYAIPERSGVVRYFVRQSGQLLWGGSREELVCRGIDGDDIKSFTFIASSLSDNQILMKTDRGYLANLKALPMVEQERLLYGNWRIRPAAGMYFKRSQIPEEGWLEKIPNDVVSWVRSWDLAATDESEHGDPAYTAGVLIGKRKNGRYVIADATNVRLSAAKVREHIKSTAMMDKATYKRVKIRLPKDPGQAGKEQAESYIRHLAGFSVFAVRETGSKEARAEPLAAQWQAGNVDIVLGPWTETLVTQFEAFPEGKFKDLVDAGAGGFHELEKSGASSLPPTGKSALLRDSYWNKV